MTAAVELMRKLYAPQRPTTEQLREAAQGLLAQVVELERRPTAAGYEQLASNLQGATRLALALRAEVLEVPR